MRRLAKYDRRDLDAVSQALGNSGRRDHIRVRHGDDKLFATIARRQVDREWDRFMTLMEYMCWNEGTGALNQLGSR